MDDIEREIKEELERLREHIMWILIFSLALIMLLFCAAIEYPKLSSYVDSIQRLESEAKEGLQR